MSTIDGSPIDFCVWPHRNLPPDPVNSFDAVWDTHGTVNKHVVIYGHTRVSSVSPSLNTDAFIPSTGCCFESIIMGSFIDPLRPASSRLFSNIDTLMWLLRRGVVLETRA